MVLGVPTPETAPHHFTSTRTLVVGLLKKVLDHPASPSDLADSKLSDWGFAHVRCIRMTMAAASPGSRTSPSTAC